MRKKSILLCIVAILIAMGMAAGAEESAPVEDFMEETAQNPTQLPMETPTVPTRPPEGQTLAPSTPAPTPAVRPNLAGKQFAGWFPYWDVLGALDDMTYYAEKYNDIIFFAAYFTDGDHVFVPEDLELMMQMTTESLNGYTPRRYLSIVNDYQRADGTSLLKDTDVLRRLFATPESMQGHIDEIIALVKKYQVEGIEIDYETIRTDMDLWQKMVVFTESLFLQLAEQGIPTRLVLEPNAPVESLSFPHGPEYVMMCYNLYGGHSGPGPKADIAFLERMVRKMEILPGTKNFALATGGFDWTGEGKASALTYIQALELQRRLGITPERDAASAALFFRYTDGSGVAHEVWYADEETIYTWAQVVCTTADYNISIWRMGGNI